MLSGGRTSALNGKYYKNAQNSLKIISGVPKNSENDHFEVFNIFGLSQEPPGAGPQISRSMDFLDFAQLPSVVVVRNYRVVAETIPKLQTYIKSTRLVEI